MCCFYPSQASSTEDLQLCVRFAEIARCTGQVKKRLESSLHLQCGLFFFFSTPIAFELLLLGSSREVKMWGWRNWRWGEGRRGERKARRELLLSKINQSIEKALKSYLKKKKINSQSQHTHCISTNRIVMCLPLICAASPYALPCAHVMSF